ncbi:MAG: hypothetical protein HKN34_01440, partial [Gammaproteobacteria bacterium]|nr:hypothetical protein [Gammaproteobacteria bacterium]
MDTVRFANILRLIMFSVFTVLAVAACGADEENSDTKIEGGTRSDKLTITPPADRQSEATGMLTIVAPGQASASGGKGSYAFSHNAPANGFPLGTTMVNWTVVDGSGSRSSGMQAVTMSDTTAPVIS